MNGLMIILIVLMLSQSLLSIVQVKYYQSFIKRITTEQAGTEYEFYTEVVKGKVLRTIVAVVVDTDGKVIQCYICKGLTIFARFKEEQSYRGVQLVSYSTLKQEKKAPQIDRALSQIYTRKLEAVT
ncbi:transcriptional regulator GutM [Enterococcus sp. AZ196]|uniref:transcriptional regulator GutM n=1 Tax=Enterococcus sp. AZ196 TaxID=2774659 RepID=UPI003D2C05A3